MTAQFNMPRLGLGTWRLYDDEACDTVAQALQMGYRHIDTAAMYENEAAVGAGIKQSGVARDELFVTTKIWHDQLSPQAMQQSIETSLQKLQLDDVDLLLIHWPSTEANWDMAASLQTLLSIKQQGLTKHIGVANFPVALLEQAHAVLGDELAVNQVEYHLGLQQQAVLQFTQAHNMVLTAYCPLARGEYSEHPVVQTIANKHHAQTSQIALAWLLNQQDVAAIPKSANKERLHSNLAAATIQLDQDDMQQLSTLAKNHRIVNPDFAPKWDA